MSDVRNVHSQISKGLQAFKDAAHNDALACWTKLSLKQRCEIARAMVLMESAAKKPANYFSYSRTYGPWQTRANKFKAGYGINDDKIAMEAVTNPAEEFVAKVNFVWGNQNLSEMYKKFCELVYLWEYARKTEQKDSALDVYETAISFGVGAINEYLAEIQKNQCAMQKIKTMLCK